MLTNNPEKSIFRSPSTIIPVVFLLCLLISYWYIANLHKDLLWLALGGTWGAFFIYLAVVTQRDWARASLITCALCLLVLVGFEKWLWLQRPDLLKVKWEGDFEEVGYFIDHPVLGTAARPGVVAHFSKLVDGNPLYDVVYHIDENGLRVTSSSVKNPKPEACTLFFGGSFTFGEGVSDTQAMPSRVAALGNGKINAYNFGFHGYGPHEMLAAIEGGMVEEAIQCKPTHMVYQAIPHHVHRSAGRLLSGFHAPRYRLVDDQQVVRDGFFDDESWLHPKVRSFFNRSLLFRELTKSRKPMSKDDIDLFIAIVNQSRNILQQRNPGLKFKLLLWRDGSDKLAITLRDKLINRGIDVVLTEDVTNMEEREKYRLSTGDPHPNAEAHDRIAKYLLNWLLASINDKLAG